MRPKWALKINENFNCFKLLKMSCKKIHRMIFYVGIIESDMLHSGELFQWFNGKAKIECHCQRGKKQRSFHRVN